MRYLAAVLVLIFAGPAFGQHVKTKVECQSLIGGTHTVCTTTKGKQTVYTDTDTSVPGDTSAEVITAKRYKELLAIDIEYEKQRAASSEAETRKLEAQVCANWHDTSTLPSYCK